MPSVYGAEEYRPDALAMHHLHASARRSWYSGLYRLAELLSHLLYESPKPFSKAEASHHYALLSLPLMKRFLLSLFSSSSPSS